MNISGIRTIILHNHLFKNAGSTFDWSLKRNFGEDFVDQRDNEKMIQGARYLGPFVYDNASLKALSSHHLKFPLPDIPPMNFLPVILLRHPVDRIGSVYSFEKKQIADTPGAIHSKNKSFKEYVKWRMSPDVPITIRNFQTNRCLDVPANIKGFIGRPLTEADYIQAADRLAGISLIGLVDMYDESMVVFEETLRPNFPEIDLSYVVQNRLRGNSQSMEDRVVSIYSELGLEVSDMVLLENHWDLKLYYHARSLLIERTVDIDKFEDKLSSFRKRCHLVRHR